MFDKLDKSDFYDYEKAESLGVISNMPIDNKYFRQHANFFTSIGYIAHQVALIEDDIRQSMMMITDDYDAVVEQTEGRNLGSLLSLYELVFLAKFGNDTKRKDWFYAVKKTLLKANKYRNEAVHANWMFLGKGADKPCYESKKKSLQGFIVVTPKLMRKRAIFVYSAFDYMLDLRAVTEEPYGFSPEVITAAEKNLSKLTKGILKLKTFKKRSKPKS